jgi:hypothetical protein
MKKLALIFIVSVLCISPFTASAGSNGWKNFQGTYEMIASGSCIHSVAGWEDSNDPPNYDLDVATPPLSYPSLCCNHCNQWYLDFQQRWDGKLYSDKLCYNLARERNTRPRTVRTTSFRSLHFHSFTLWRYHRNYW